MSFRNVGGASLAIEDFGFPQASLGPSGGFVGSCLVAGRAELQKAQHWAENEVTVQSYFNTFSFLSQLTQPPGFVLSNTDDSVRGHDFCLLIVLGEENCLKY